MSCVSKPLGALLFALPLIAHAGDRPPPLDAMPQALEMRLALSALPPPLRAKATVHVLDPQAGYRLARSGSSGIECVVQRTAWEMIQYREDIFIPLCFDAAGSRSLLKPIMDTATMRAQGVTAEAAKELIERRFADGTYATPARAGVSYMLAPVMRTIGPPDLQVHTMAMPHLMFYAPGLNNADIGAQPDLANADSLRYPFIDRQGHDAQTYIIQLVGAREKARIAADEAKLLRDLCRFQAALCLPKLGPRSHRAGTHHQPSNATPGVTAAETAATAPAAR